MDLPLRPTVAWLRRFTFRDVDTGSELVQRFFLVAVHTGGLTTVSNKIIPAEVHTLLEFRQRDWPGFAIVNTALREFRRKAAFSWHLSVLICCDDLVENRLPSANEQNVLYEFEDRLASLITADDNALFLARVTHDARREIIWRVHEPEAPHAALNGILASKNYPREFDYRIENDPEWRKTDWYLTNGASD
jgi:hypothetical protein